MDQQKKELMILEQEVAILRIAYADLLERHAKLKAHAEAMAMNIELSEIAFNMYSHELVAYRADFPEEE